MKYLDLKVVHEGAGRNAFLSHGPGARLALHIGEPAGNPAAVSFIEVEDADGLYTRLSRQGVPFDVTPSDRPMWGGRVAALRDPVGHVVKIGSYLLRTVAKVWVLGLVTFSAASALIVMNTPVAKDAVKEEACRGFALHRVRWRWSLSL